MEISPLLIIFGVGAAMFALLLMLGARARRGGISPDAGKAAEIVFAGLAAINIAGVLGFLWFAARMLVHDGVMVVELAICAVPIAVLTMITGGAFALKRRGKAKAAAALLVVGALPTIAAYGFLLYLDSHPIDMR